MTVYDTITIIRILYYTCVQETHETQQEISGTVQIDQVVLCRILEKQVH